jgi:trk system potassium uptake protein TrkA
LSASSKQLTGSVLVAGLGRFGTAVASTLVQDGVEVLAIEQDSRLVAIWADQLIHVVQADCSDDDVLRQLGVGQFDHAVVAIGSNVESSLLTVLALSEAGVPDIWAKADTSKHGNILSRVGAHHVIYPEKLMGQRVARALLGTATGDSPLN